MIFTNQPNKKKQTKEGEVLWHTRSVAVNTYVFAIDSNRGQTFLLLDQRGPAVPDFEGYWNTPCGYLDWSETIAEAAIREVWEETGVSIPHLLNNYTTVNSSFKLNNVDQSVAQYCMLNGYKVPEKDQSEKVFNEDSNHTPIVTARPFLMNDVPVKEDGKYKQTQNVVFHYMHSFLIDDELPALSDVNNEPGETTAIEWTELSNLKNYKLAFNQAQLVDMALRFSIALY